MPLEVSLDLCVLIVLLLAIGELWMGRDLLPPRVRLWGGTEESSRQILDWYSPSHLIHGLIFYGLTGNFLASVVIESAWELLENSPLIINRYRQTSSETYAGDTVLNSLSDVLCMSIGFGIASQLAWGYTVAIAVFFELFTLVMIRDNLTLNIVMLIYPFESIKQWQLRLTTSKVDLEQ